MADFLVTFLLKYLPEVLDQYSPDGLQFYHQNLSISPGVDNPVSDATVITTSTVIPATTFFSGSNTGHLSPKDGVLKHVRKRYSSRLIQRLSSIPVHQGHQHTLQPVNLPKILPQKANFSSGVGDEVNSILRELRLINIFLKNSDEKRNEHEIVKELVGQIGDVAYEALDVIDTFIHGITIPGTRHEMIHFNNARMLHNVAKKMEDLNEEIYKIYGNIEKYGIESGEASADATKDTHYELRSDKDVVGFDDHSTTLHNRRREVEEDDMVGFVDDW